MGALYYKVYCAYTLPNGAMALLNQMSVFRIPGVSLSLVAFVKMRAVRSRLCRQLRNRCHRDPEVGYTYIPRGGLYTDPEVGYT